MTDNEAAIFSRINSANGDDLFFALRVLADYYEEMGGPNAVLAEGLRWMADVRRVPYGDQQDAMFYAGYYDAKGLLWIASNRKRRYHWLDRELFKFTGRMSRPTRSAAYLAAAQAFADASQDITRNE